MRQLSYGLMCSLMGLCAALAGYPSLHLKCALGGKRFIRCYIIVVIVVIALMLVFCLKLCFERTELIRLCYPPLPDLSTEPFGF